MSPMNGPILKIFALAGPSGSGKSILARELISSKSNVKMWMQCTTRPRRTTDDGYIFLSDGEFNHYRSLLTCITEFGGARYGTVPEEFDGQDIVTIADVMGLKNLIADVDAHNITIDQGHGKSKFGSIRGKIQVLPILLTYDIYNEELRLARTVERNRTLEFIEGELERLLKSDINWWWRHDNTTEYLTAADVVRLASEKIPKEQDVVPEPGAVWEKICSALKESLTDRSGSLLSPLNETETGFIERELGKLEPSQRLQVLERATASLKDIVLKTLASEIAQIEDPTPVEISQRDTAQTDLFKDPINGPDEGSEMPRATDAINDATPTKKVFRPSKEIFGLEDFQDWIDQNLTLRRSSYSNDYTMRAAAQGFVFSFAGNPANISARTQVINGVPTVTILETNNEGLNGVAIATFNLDSESRSLKRVK